MDIIDCVAIKLGVDKHKNLFGLCFDDIGIGQQSHYTNSHSQLNPTLYSTETESSDSTSNNLNNNSSNLFLQNSSSSNVCKFPRWLSSDKRLVQDHDFLKNIPIDEPIKLHFRVKYYVKHFLELNNPDCINLYYNNARCLLLNYCKFDNLLDNLHINLAALMLQAQYHNFDVFLQKLKIKIINNSRVTNFNHEITEASTQTDLNSNTENSEKLDLTPEQDENLNQIILNLLNKNISKSFINQILHKHASHEDPTLQNTILDNIYNQTIKEWQKLKSIPKHECIIRFMLTLENSCPMYGLHYFPITSRENKKLTTLNDRDVNKYLGIGLNGITEYDKHDLTLPLKEYPWRQLESLYHKDNKFTAETAPANSPKSESQSHGSNGDSNHSGESQRYIWYGPKDIIFNIWNMAIHQHKFFIDRYPGNVTEVSKKFMNHPKS